LGWRGVSEGYVGKDENELYHNVVKVFGMDGKGVEYDQVNVSVI